jgi:hypothetical protein
VRERFGADGDALAALLETLERQRYTPTARVRPDRGLTREFGTLAGQLASHPARG